MFDLQLVTAVATGIGFLAIETSSIKSIFYIVALLFPLLWINRGVLIPWLFNSQEVQRKKRNFWWMQAYHEERIGKRPTSILRRTSSGSSSNSSMSSSSMSSSNYINSEDEKDTSMIADRRDQERMNSSSIISDNGEMIGWNREKKAVKHVRFEAPLTTTSSAFPALFGEDNNYRFMMGDQKTCRYFEQLGRN
ncbi:hypothetical protein GcC1_005029 [Golovinomyces cichoracearum]|uniref:Uncharacterized protein n=1 Tax=Golovinomyces cichoracearum TaxID=62708 RepID=A0A420J8R9_9PEZI|nr:hypothetical protein GcC1_005029 [Golovinomyces cichoracearum]